MLAWVVRGNVQRTDPGRAGGDAAVSGSGRRSARERTLAVAFASAQTVAQKLDETLRPLMKKYGVTALKPGGMDMRTPTLVVYAGGWRQCRRALPATVLAATDVVAAQVHLPVCAGGGCRNAAPAGTLHFRVMC